MPWTSDDAERHTHKASTPELKELWAKVARSRDICRSISSLPASGKSESDRALY
jgi:hypothetical protein